jgi:hypothetical protein
MQEAAYKVGTKLMHLLVTAFATEPAGKIEVNTSSTSCGTGPLIKPE